MLFSMIFQETGVRMQGFGDNSYRVLPFDDSDEEMHILFIETRDNKTRLEHFGEENLEIFGEGDEEMQNLVFLRRTWSKLVIPLLL